MKKLSLYDITYGYLKKYYRGDVNDNTVMDTMEGFKKALEKGWTEKEIIQAIKTFNKGGSSHDSLMRYFSKMNPKDRNLLKADTFYWHSQLRITPGAPKRVVDYDSGEIKKVDEPHFLEMRASYTMDDLLAYYELQHGEVEDHQRNKYRGALKYVLNNYSIDTVLFMIDASANFIKAEDYEPLGSPLGIQDYARQAQHLIGEKITEERTAGDDKIVPRKRLPLHRGRSKDKRREGRVPQEHTARA
jgi:hypothetical protein